jgi:hypothetical protein
MIKIFGHAIDYFERKGCVFGLLRVYGNGGIMVDSEPFRPDCFKVEDKAEIIKEGSGISPVGAKPERRFNAGSDAGIIHPLIVISGSGIHVNMRLDDNHDFADCRFPIADFRFENYPVTRCAATGKLQIPEKVSIN